MDLVGIEPEKQWAVMRDLAAYADGSAWDSLWVYDHFHTVPLPSDEATLDHKLAVVSFATASLEPAQTAAALRELRQAYASSDPADLPAPGATGAVVAVDVEPRAACSGRTEADAVVAG